MRNGTSTILISCSEEGLGDQLLSTWIASRLWRNSGFPSAIALLPANSPHWVRSALAGMHIWEMPRFCGSELEIEKYDQLISTAARWSGVAHIEALGGPYHNIPTYGQWSRCDDYLYTRLTQMASSQIYPQCPFDPAVPTVVHHWLLQKGLGRAPNLVIVHARTGSWYVYKNPVQSKIRDLVETLLTELPVEVLLLCALQRIDNGHRNGLCVCQELLPLPLLSGLLSRAAALIDSDSGIRHLAGMVGTNIVTFDSPQDNGFGPFTSKDRIHRVPIITRRQSISKPFDFEPEKIVDAVAKTLGYQSDRNSL